MIQDEDQTLVFSAAEIYRNIPTSFSKAFSKAHALECAGISLKRAQDPEYQLAMDACLNCHMKPCNSPEDRFKLLWPRIKVFLYAKKKTIAGVMRLAGFPKDEIKQGPQYQRCRRWVSSHQKKKNLNNADKAPYKPCQRLLSLLSSQENKKNSAPTPVLQITVKILEMKADCNLVSPLTCHSTDASHFEDDAEVCVPFLPTLDTQLVEDGLPGDEENELQVSSKPPGCQHIFPAREQSQDAAPSTMISQKSLPCVLATVSDASAQGYSEKQLEALRRLAVEVGTHVLCEIQKMEICPPQFRTSADVANEMNKLFAVDLLRAASKK
jgi:hypothetical protein